MLGGGGNKLSRLIISVGSLSGTLMFFLGVTIQLSVAQLKSDVTRIKKKNSRAGLSNSQFPVKDLNYNLIKVAHAGVVVVAEKNVKPDVGAMWANLCICACRNTQTGTREKHTMWVNMQTCAFDSPTPSD